MPLPWRPEAKVDFILSRPLLVVGAFGANAHLLQGEAYFTADVFPPVFRSILEKTEEMTAFLNPNEDSYKRFGQNKAPRFISWSKENRSQLIRIPAAIGEYHRAELRRMFSPRSSGAMSIYPASS